MGLTDKVSGKVKQAAGDITGDKSLHREGRQEERKGDANDELEAEIERLLPGLVAAGYAELEDDTWGLTATGRARADELEQGAD